MKTNRFRFKLMLLLALGGCTVHPPGEKQERHAAMQALRSFQRAASSQPSLPEPATAEDLIEYALQNNGDLEQKYWAWRSAIEQIPQDGTQSTNLALSASIGINRGSTSLGDTALAIGNDPMADIVLPAKLSIAARRALEDARAAGIRFRKAGFELRSKVLIAASEYSRTAEQIRLDQAGVELLRTAAAVTEARNQAGAASQQDLLKARNEVDLSLNDIQAMRAQLPVQRAAINALLNRPVGATLQIAPQMPVTKTIVMNDEEILSLAAKQNPELEAMAYDAAGRRAGITLARLQYLPDFSVNVGSDLSGIGQSILGMVTVPILRREAIDAAVAQAEANLRQVDSMRRQARGNNAAEIILDIATFRDADRQLDLLRKTVIPRSEQMVTLSRAGYETGRGTLSDLLDNRRSLLSLQRLELNLRASREKAVAQLEAILGQAVTEGESQEKNVR